MKLFQKLFNRQIFRNQLLNYLYDFYIVRGIKIEVKDRQKFDTYAKTEQNKEIIQNILIVFLLIILFVFFFYLGVKI